MVLPAFDPVQCGARLKKARLARGFTQEYVRNYLGYSSRATVSSHEAGERMPRPDEIQRLADLYGVSIDWLFNGFENDDSQLMELARKYENVLIALASMAPDKANDVVLRIGAVADMFPREDAPEPPTKSSASLPRQKKLG